MAEKTAQMSNKDRYMERLKAKYPDKEYVDEEAVYGQINDDYDDYDNRIVEYEQERDSFKQLFDNDPRSAAFLSNWKKGGNAVVELVRMFGDDFNEEMNDPKNQEELAKTSKEFADKIAKEAEYGRQYQQNIEETKATIAKVQEEEGRSDDEVDKAMEFLAGIMTDGILGKFSEESIKAAFKAIDHDKDVEMASQEGEVRGRNAKIEERLRKPMKGDGMANLNGNAGATAKRDIPELGVLNKYGGSADIWERGGMKRKKV